MGRRLAALNWIINGTPCRDHCTLAFTQSSCETAHKKRTDILVANWKPILRTWSHGQTQSIMRRRKLIMQSSRQQLAIDGGAAMLPEGPPRWPLRDERVRENLLQAYEQGAWGQYHGPFVEQLEQVIAARHDVAHALACSSGTIAVELALRGLKVGAGDEVILAGYDFSGNFRAVEATGARPVLADLQERTWTLDPEQVEAAVGPQTKAIVVSHLHASIAAMRELIAIAGRHDLAVVEDACQAQGARVEGRLAGTWGDVGVWSFGGSKLLTAGRGGAIFTARDDAYQRAKVYCERGNHAFALSELQAAVLLPQIAKLDERNEQRQRNAAQLYRQTASIGCLVPPAANPPNSQAAYYKASWIFDSVTCGKLSREQFIHAVQAEGVALDAGFRGFVRRPESRCRRIGRLPHSERAADATLVLHHPVLLEPAATIGLIARAMAKVAGE